MLHEQNDVNVNWYTVVFGSAFWKVKTKPDSTYVHKYICPFQLNRELLIHKKIKYALIAVFDKLSKSERKVHSCRCNGVGDLT